MKYYYNVEKDLLLIDLNPSTPYLKDRGYVEITKEVYDRKTKELIKKHENEENEEK